MDHRLILFTGELLALTAMVFILVGLIAVFASGFQSIAGGAPFVPMPRRKIKELLVFGGLNSQDVFFDLGCGDGRALICAVNEFGVKKAVGYDIAYWPVLKSRIIARRFISDGRIIIQRQNILKSDLSEATFIYIYLFPALVLKAAYKINKEAKTGAKILCADFKIETDRFQSIKLIKHEKIGNISVYLYEKT